jgi:hypothetical protein
VQTIILESSTGALPKVVDLKRDDQVCWLKQSHVYHVVGDVICQTRIIPGRSSTLDATCDVRPLTSKSRLIQSSIVLIVQTQLIWQILEPGTCVCIGSYWRVRLGIINGTQHSASIIHLY